MSDKSVDNIMVIESESFLRKEILSALDSDVFIVADVSDCFEALWLLNEFRPDLVIIDEDLPLMDGWETCRCLNQTFGIPAVITGRNADNEAWIKTLEVGADFYLRAPFSPKVLAARVKAILRRYKKAAVSR